MHESIHFLCRAGFDIGRGDASKVYFHPLFCNVSCHDQLPHLAIRVVDDTCTKHVLACHVSKSTDCALARLHPHLREFLDHLPSLFLRITEKLAVVVSISTSTLLVGIIPALCNNLQRARFIFGKLCLSVVLDALEGCGNKLVKIAFASDAFLVFR